MKKIGDKIYYAKFGLTAKTIPCNVCFGKRFITCIKGNGEKVTVECRGCEKGYLGSTGTQKIYEYKPDVVLANINRIEVTDEGVEYCTNCGCGKDRCFNKKEDAILKAEELAKKHHEEQIKRIRHKEKPNKDWTWHVYYHQRCMKQAEKDFFYHQDKLNISREMKKKFPRRMEAQDGED